MTSYSVKSCESCPHLLLTFFSSFSGKVTGFHTLLTVNKAFLSKNHNNFMSLPNDIPVQKVL